MSGINSTSKTQLPEDIEEKLNLYLKAIESAKEDKENIEKDIVSKTSILNALIKDIENKNDELSILISSFNEKNKQLSDRESQLNEKDSALNIYSKALSEKEEALQKVAILSNTE
jgi:chromosome segregation ATPase